MRLRIHIVAVNNVPLYVSQRSLDSKAPPLRHPREQAHLGDGKELVAPMLDIGCKSVPEQATSTERRRSRDLKRYSRTIHNLKCTKVASHIFECFKNFGFQVVGGTFAHGESQSGVGSVQSRGPTGRAGGASDTYLASFRS